MCGFFSLGSIFFFFLFIRLDGVHFAPALCFVWFVERF